MGTRTITTKLAVEGEARYKQSIAACNAELKTLKSDLALVESEFRNNANSMEALTAKGTALQAVYDKQLEKVTELEAAMLNARQAQDGYAARVATAQDNVQRYEQGLERLRQSTEDTSQEQEELTRELDKWNAELTEAQAGQAAAERGVRDWQRQLNRAKIELNGLSDEIARNDQYLNEAGQSADGCARSIDQYGKAVKEAGECSEDFADGTQRSEQGIQQLAAALAAAGVAKSVKEIADELLACAAAAGSFETAMAKVSTLAGPENLEGMKAQLMELSNETGAAVGALAEAAYQAMSAGVDAAGAVDFVATATKTASAGFTDSSTAVDVLTTALNAYKLEGDQAERVASMLVKTQDEGKTSVGELAQNMGRVIPMAAAYNVSLGNLTTAYALLTKNGTNTAIATTNLGAMLTELAKDGSVAADILQNQTGKSFSELMASGEDLGGIMAILSDSVDGNATAFSNLWSSTTAGQAALSLLNSGAEEFTRTLGVMETSSGAVERNFQTMASTTEFAQQRMVNAAENLRIAIGNQLNPALEDLYATGADAFTWATDFVEEHPWVVGAVTGLTTALGSLAATTGVLAAANIPGVLTAIKGALDILSAHPVILVATALAGLAAAVAVWGSTADDASTSASELTAALKESKRAYDDLMSSMAGEQTSIESTAKALHDLLGVENRSAAQKAAIKALVDQLNQAVPGLGLAYDEESDSLANLTEKELDSTLAKKKAQEEYQAQVERLSQLYVERADISARLAEAQEQMTAAEESHGTAVMSTANAYEMAASARAGANTQTMEASRTVNELTAAEAENAAQIAELETATSAYAEVQGAEEEKIAGMTARMDGLTAGMEALNAAYTESYHAAYASIEGQLGLFNELDGTAKTTIDDLIDTLEGQVEYMDTYAANIQRAMELGVDEGLIRKLSDGSQESAQILAAIVKGGEDKVAELNEQFAKVQEGKDDFADTVAQMEADFDKKMGEMVGDLKEAIEDMDLHDEAYQAGVNDIQGLIDGMEYKRGDAVATAISIAQDVRNAYLREQDQHSPSKKFAKAGANDIQGLIEGAEGKRANLSAAYIGLAKTAMESYANGVRGSLDAVAEAMAQFDAALKDIDSFYGLKADVGDLEYQLWERTDGKHVSDMEKYAKQLELLGRKQADQEEIVKAAAAAYEAAVAQYGEGTEGSYEYQKALLQEKLALQDLLDEISEVTAAKQKMFREMAEQQAQLAWESSGLGVASAVAQDRGYITPQEVAQIANCRIVTPDGYAQAAQNVLDRMASHLPATLEEPRASETLGRQMEAMTAATVNAISGIAQRGISGPVAINLVLEDGAKLASYLFDPLADYGNSNGTPILNPVR